MREQLNLLEFSGYFRNFYSIPTWTKEKHVCHDKLIDFLHRHENVKINSNYNSKITKVKGSNHFTIFKVEEKQRGNMQSYRGKWVIMYCYDRYQTKFSLMVLPLNHGFDKNQSRSLLKEFGLAYDESPETP